MCSRMRSSGAGAMLVPLLLLPDRSRVVWEGTRMICLGMSGSRVAFWLWRGEWKWCDWVHSVGMRCMWRVDGEDVY